MFADCTSLTSIVLPYDEIELAVGIFSGCSGLVNITMPSSLKIIDASAFNDCTSLTEINIPNKVTSIGYEAFRGCINLTRVKIPRSVVEIGSNAFYEDDNLTIYCYKDSVAHRYAEENEINYVLMDECYSFDITENGELTVTVLSDLPYLDIPEKVNEIKVKSIKCVNIKNTTQHYKLDYVLLPNTLETIADYAFVGCGIEEINLPNSLKTIGKEAFNDNNLKEVIIPESVEMIKDGAYKNCVKLERITIPNDVQITSNPFERCNKLIIYCYEGSDAQEIAEEYSIPYELLDENFFDGIKYYLNKVEKTATVIKVTEEAVKNGKLNIPSVITTNKNEKYTVTIINENAVDLDGITSLELPKTLIAIKNSAFTKYTGDVEIPENVKEFYLNSFATHEANIIINEDNPYYRIIDNVLMDGGDVPNIYYGIYKESDNVIHHTVPEYITEIGDRAFKYCTKVQKIKIGAQVNNIGNNAFDGVEDKITIQGYNDSYAQRYATQHNINFESLGEYPYFRWKEDNYGFNNSSGFFSSYDIGEYEKYLSYVLIENYKDETKNAKWEGSCYGMAATALLFKIRTIITRLLAN